jgi:hypothetical protein
MNLVNIVVILETLPLQADTCIFLLLVLYILVVL